MTSIVYLASFTIIMSIAESANLLMVLIAHDIYLIVEQADAV